MQALKLNNLIINRLLYSCLKGICPHDGIFILISTACLITPLDHGKWQYTAFRVGIKDIRFEIFEYPWTIFSIDHVSLGISDVFFFSSHE